MNRINPLHILALLAVVLLFFIVKLNGAKSEFIHTKENYKKVFNVATQLKGLEDTYSNSKKQRKLLQKILRNPSLHTLKVEEKFTNSGVILKVKSINKKSLNILMTKILNNSFNISSFKIKRLNKTNASFKMEIKW